MDGRSIDVLDRLVQVLLLAPLVYIVLFFVFLFVARRRSPRTRSEDHDKSTEPEHFPEVNTSGCSLQRVVEAFKRRYTRKELTTVTLTSSVSDLCSWFYLATLTSQFTYSYHWNNGLAAGNAHIFAGSLQTNISTDMSRMVCSEEQIQDILSEVIIFVCCLAVVALRFDISTSYLSPDSQNDSSGQIADVTIPLKHSSDECRRQGKPTQVGYKWLTKPHIRFPSAYYYTVSIVALSLLAVYVAFSSSLLPQYLTGSTLCIAQTESIPYHVFVTVYTLESVLLYVAPLIACYKAYPVSDHVTASRDHRGVEEPDFPSKKCLGPDDGMVGLAGSSSRRDVWSKAMSISMIVCLPSLHWLIVCTYTWVTGDPLIVALQSFIGLKFVVFSSILSTCWNFLIMS